MAAIDRAPVTTWKFYSILLIVIATFNHAVMWIDGSLPLGEVSRVRLGDAGYVVIALGAYHHLSGVARTSFWRFRPLLSISEPAAVTLEHSLTTMPRSFGWWALVGGVALAVSSLQTQPAAFGLDARVGPAATAYVYLFSCIAFSIMVALVLQVVRQLGQVSSLHRQATGLDLFRLQPIHAFATLTSRTGAGLAVFIVYSGLVEAGNITNLNVVALLAMGLLAVVVFVVPLLGMRGRLVEEKARALDETSHALQLTIGRVHEQVDANEHDKMDGLSTTLSTLVVERDLIRGISTWPWEQGTARGFASALVIPLVVWLVTRLLERFL